MTFQIFVQSLDPQIPTKALTLTPTPTPTPNQTLHHLKLSLLSTQSLSSFYFTLNGKTLPDSTPLQIPQIAPLSTLILQPRLPGGGGDGGATGAESRDCYLHMYDEKKPDKVDPNEQRLSKWSNCALSNEPLREPCVIDKLGNVFNKEALVEALLGKKLPKAFGHIKGLKDMITVKLSMIPGAELDENVHDGTRFECPITGLAFNGKYKFFALRNCRHVLSAKALKEKKTKKVKNGETGVNGEEGIGLEAPRLSGKKHGIDVKAVEKVSGKVEGNGKVVNGEVGVKGVGNGSVKRFKAVDLAPANATKEVYASIFTSSRKSNFKETYSCRSLPLGRN
ncbi:hypothetical protein ACB098_01G326100 [Castanea mollissima]